MDVVEGLGSQNTEYLLMRDDEILKELTGVREVEHNGYRTVGKVSPG